MTDMSELDRTVERKTDAGEGRLKDALASLNTRLDQIVRAPGRISSRSTARAAASIGADQPEVSLPKDDVLARTRKAVSAALAAGALDRLSRRELREAAWLLWAGREPLAGARGVLEHICLAARSSRAVRRNLLDAWMLGFDGAMPRIAEGGHAIRSLIGQSDDSRLDGLLQADRAYRIFDCQEGPARLAEAILTASEPVEEILRQARLDDPQRAVGGYARAVHAALADQVGSALVGRNGGVVLERALSFLTLDHKLRFPDPQARGAAVRGLLAPWMEKRAPSQAVQDALQVWLLDQLGDPRFRKEAWAPVGEEATAIVRRWLGKATFKAFFALIDEINSDHQWKDRQVFWSQYLKADLVADIWLALGSQLHANAKAVRELRGSYARLKGKNGQAALLFRIGDLVFCEWSNVGKVRAWTLSHTQAPRLDQTEYFAADLKGPSLHFDRHSDAISRDGGLSHTGTDRGLWQGRAARFIAARTGLVPPRPTSRTPR